MIQILTKGSASLHPVALEDLRRDKKGLADALWIDLLNPASEEEEFVEKQLGVDLPAQAKMEEIEESSRMYEANGALHLSCWLLSYEATIPENSSVTFVVNRKHLVSVRYSDHHSFRLFSSPRKRVQPQVFNTVNDVFIELLDVTVGHIASTLRNIEQSLNTISLEVFADQDAQQRLTHQSTGGLKRVVQRLGKRNSLVASLRENSMSLQNITPFLTEQAREWLTQDQTARLRTLERDINSLREYDGQLSAEINFLLDSTVGLISIDQNQTMKILSVAALILAFI